MRRFLLPFLVTAVFIAESIFVNFVAFLPEMREWIISPRFVLVVLVFMALYCSLKLSMIYGAVFGMLYDVAFTDVLGVYMFGIPVVCYFIFKLMKVLQSNLVMVLIMSLLAVTAIEFYIFGVNILVNVTDMTIDRFIQQRLYPTAIVNIIFSLIFCYPLKKGFQKISSQFADERL